MSTITGSLMYRAKRSGVVVYARWRDSRRDEHTKRLGAAWVQQKDGQWRDRRSKPDGTLSINDAHVAMRAMIAEQEQTIAGDDAAVRDATFKDVAEAWLRDGELVAQWSPSTVRQHGYLTRRYFLPTFGARRIDSIARADVGRWWTGLHDPTRPDGALKARNANRTLTELRALFTWAAEPYGLSGNPTAGIAKHAEARNERPKFCTVEQVELLTRHAQTERDALMIRVAAFTGLRRGELVSLRWGKIDFAASSLYVDESVSDGQSKPPKSGKGRTVPMAPQVAQALEGWRPDDATDNALVFSESGRRIDGDALSKRFRRIRNSAGLPALTFHDLRHTFGSLCVDGGASVVQVKGWLGHADLATTMRYLHVKSRDSDAALLGRIFEADAVAQVGH